MWILFFVHVRALHALEVENVVVRNHGWAWPQKEPSQERVAPQSDSPNSNVTQDLTVVRRHDGSALNDSHGSVRKEFPWPVRENHTNRTPRGVALEIDARANVIQRDSLGENTGIAIEHQAVEGVVRGTAVESKNPAELLEPSRAHEQRDQPEQLGQPESSPSMASAGLSQARNALAQLRHQIAGKMRSSDGDVLETMIVAVLIILIIAFVLLCVKVAVGRYRERNQWSQSHNVAMMRATNSIRGSAGLMGSSPQAVGRTPSQNSNARPGRRQSTGAAGTPTFNPLTRAGGASVRSSSARRASTER